MQKPTCYLFRNEYATEEDFVFARDLYQDLGFRVVTYVEGNDPGKILDAFETILGNHIHDRALFPEGGEK